MRLISRMLVVLCLASSSLVVGIADGLAAQKDPGFPERSSDGGPARSSSKSVRSAFALDASDQRIAWLRALEGAQVTRWLGALFTSDELAHVGRQLQSERSAGASHDEIQAALGGDFAGVWADRATGGIEVLTAGDPEHARDVVEARTGAEVSVRQVKRSDDDLRALSAQIASGSSLPSEGYEIVGTARAPMDNQVVVSVKGDVAVARAELEQRHGDAVVVESSGLALSYSRTTGPGSNPPSTWNAGKKINEINKPNAYCTGAFGVEKDGAPHIVTAGHCAPPGNTSWYVGTNHLGTLRNPQAVSAYGFADASLIEVSSSWVGSNCVYLSSTECHDVLTYGDARVGDTICYSGATSGYNCSVVAIERDTYYEPFDLTPTVGWAFFDTLEAPNLLDICLHGDSGAPVFSPWLPGYDYVIGRGVFSYTTTDSCGNNRWGFSRWSHVQRELGIEGGCGGEWGDNEGCGTNAFTDIGTNHPDRIALNSLAGAGVVMGYPDGSFQEHNLINRAAAITWLWRRAGSPTGSPNPGFVDVGPTHANRQAIWWAAQLGLDPGYTGSTCGGGSGTKCFKPTSNMTRGDWARALYRAAESPFDGVSPVPVPAYPPCDVTSTSPLYRAMMWNMKERLVKAIPEPNACSGPFVGQRYQPSASITRGVAAASLYDLHRYCTVEEPETCYQ